MEIDLRTRAVEGEQLPTHAEPSSTGEAGLPRAPTALVVDDEPDVRDWLRLSLSLRGWHVLEAADPSSAVATCERTEPDVVILDQQFPDGVRGVDAAAALRERGADYPIVLFSAFPDREAMQRASDLDVLPMSKVDRASLFRVLDTLLEGALEKRELVHRAAPPV